jgi:tetratricopeptide (TPR) repeat protein
MTKSYSYLAMMVALLLGACSSGPSVRAGGAATWMSSPSVPGAASPVASGSGPVPVSSDADVRFKAALHLLQAHQMSEAETAFTALAKDFPAFSGPLTDLGIVYAQGRKPDQAIASLSRAIQANPANAVALNWLGILYRRSGDYARAEDAYKRAIAARADYAPAHLNLGILYEECLKRPQDALSEYRNYQQATSGNKLIVDVWIRELQAKTPTATASANSGIQP